MPRRVLTVQEFFVVGSTAKSLKIVTRHQYQAGQYSIRDIHEGPVRNIKYDLYRNREGRFLLSWEDDSGGGEVMVTSIEQPLANVLHQTADEFDYTITI